MQWFTKAYKLWPLNILWHEAPITIVAMVLMKYWSRKARMPLDSSISILQLLQFISMHLNSSQCFSGLREMQQQRTEGLCALVQPFGRVSLLQAILKLEESFLWNWKLKLFWSFLIDILYLRLRCGWDWGWVVGEIHDHQGDCTFSLSLARLKCILSAIYVRNARRVKSKVANVNLR